MTPKRSCSANSPARAAAAPRALPSAAIAATGLAIALCAFVLPARAGATVPSDLCTGDPCEVSGIRVIDADSDLDFGEVELRIKSTAQLTVGGSGPGTRSVTFVARSIVLEPTARIQGGGDDALVQLEATGGTVVISAGAKIDLGASAAGSGGTAWITAAGDVAVHGDVNVAGSGLESAGGAIALEAGGSIAVTSSLTAGASGTDSAGGEITLFAVTGVSLDGVVDVSSATDGGVIDIYTEAGPITVKKRLSADGGNPAGYGGSITIAADYGDVSISAPISALGGSGIEEQCGDGGQVEIAAGLSVSLGGNVSLNGGTHCYGGSVDVAAEGTITQQAGTTISVKAPGEYGAAGTFSVEAFGDVTIRTVDLTSPGWGGGFDAVSRGGRVTIAGTVDARGTGTFSVPGSIDVRACTVGVSGQLDARGSTAPPNAGHVALRASDALIVSASGVLRAATENRLLLRAGAPSIAPTSTIVPPPVVLVDLAIPACSPAPVCGNALLESGELCDEGEARNGTPAGCCAVDCRSAKAHGSSCDDGLFCNGSDTCSFNTCTLHAGNPCVALPGQCSTAACSEESHCAQPIGAACDDADGNPCTDGRCDESGACIAAPNEVSCDDGTFCNGEESCVDGGCRRTLRTCPEASCDEGAAACGTFCGDGLVQEGEECGEPGAGSCGVGETCRDCGCETGEIRGDSYVCYAADPAVVPPWQFTPATAEVRDRFETRTHDVTSVATVCSPAVVSSLEGTYPPSFQGIAQVDHSIEEGAGAPGQPPFVRSHHAYVDRFGTLQLTLTQPAGLLLRARVADFGPVAACEAAEDCTDGRTCQSGFCLPDPPTAPKKPPKAKSQVDNYKCYKVKIQTGTPRFRKERGLWIADQLGAVMLYDAVKPMRVCSPAVVAGVNGAAAAKPGQLTCYKLKRSATQPPQAAAPPRAVGARYRDFAPAFLDLAGAKELCVPSLVDVAP